MAPLAIAVLGSTFDTVVEGVVSCDGLDTNGVPTFDITGGVLGTPPDAIVGFATVVTGSPYGLRLTGLDMCVDQSMDYARGARAIVLALPGALPVGPGPPIPVAVAPFLGSRLP